MNKCETCLHYEYKAGVAPSLAAKIGLREAPPTPICYCHYAKIAWERRSANVRKPAGTPCAYEKREFTCSTCGGHNTSDALIVNSRMGVMVCKKCCVASYKKRMDEERSERS